MTRQAGTHAQESSDKVSESDAVLSRLLLPDLLEALQQSTRSRMRLLSAAEVFLLGHIADVLTTDHLSSCGFKTRELAKLSLALSKFHDMERASAQQRLAEWNLACEARRARKARRRRA